MKIDPELSTVDLTDSQMSHKFLSLGIEQLALSIAAHNSRNTNINTHPHAHIHNSSSSFLACNSKIA